MEIRWKGNDYTNSSSRQGYIPFVIVNHISAGSMSSMDSWFTSPNNQVSSAHFGISRKGEIHQYVEIERMAWAQGITNEQIPIADAQVVRDMGVNPNLYCVSIEHEGTDGDLTQVQFEASVWLHRYIQDQIFEKWNKEFPLDRYHVIGHYQVNPQGKPYCPGPKFPWEKLYTELAKVDRLKEAKRLDEILERISELESLHQNLSEKIERLEQLHRMDEVPAWAEDAVKEAVEQGLLFNPENSSYDFYRMMTVLHRKGLI